MAPRDGSSECFSLDSPRSIEACRRHGLEDSDLEEKSEQSFFRHEQPQKRRHPPSKSRSPAAGREWSSEGHGGADTTAVIRQERHEINRHRLLREVKKERSALVQGEKLKTNPIDYRLTAPQRPQRVRPMATPPVSPYALSRNTVDLSSSTGEENSSFMSTTVASSSFRSGHRRGGHDSPTASRTTPRLSRGGNSNSVLEVETQRLQALRRRRFMELQQMLAFQLRSLAREERDRLMAEKARAREAIAEAKRLKMLEDAEQARIARERSGQEREKEFERQAAVTRARQQEAARRLEARDHLRQKQAQVAAERRAGLAAEKAALLQARIDRGVRVRRARQLRNERLAAQKATAKEAAAEAARRAREAENKARKAAAAGRWESARAAAEQARRRQDEEAAAMRTAAGGKMAELEGRVASFRSRQKEIAARERELREEEAAELARERQEAARRKVEREEKRRAHVAEAKTLREKQIALAREVRREQEAAKKQAARRMKEEKRKRIVERRAKVEEERREMTRRKLEEDEAKIELLRSEKHRIQATRGQLSSETAQQRKVLQGHLEALKDQAHRCNISYAKIAVAVSAAATTGGDGGSANPAARRCNTATPRQGSPNTHRPANSAFRDVRAPSPSRSSHCEEKFGASDLPVSHPESESPHYLSGASTASSLSLPRGSHTGIGAGGDGGGASGGASGGDRRLPRRIAREKSSGKAPRKLRTATPSSDGRRGDAADLRKRYMYDNRIGNAPSTRQRKQTAARTQGNRKTRRKPPRSAGGSGREGNDDTLATAEGRETTRSTATSITKSGREVETMSCNADDGNDEDEALTAAMALLSSSSTVSNTPPSPSPPLVASDSEHLRTRYAQELVAILEEEQAAESARETALAAAKARAKAAKARATYGDANISQRGRRDKSLPSSAARKASQVTDHGDLQRRREEEAAVAAREEANLKRALARERREASDRVMRVSEEYEKALEKLASVGGKSTNSSPAEESAAG
eukprot:g2534.t1